MAYCRKCGEVIDDEAVFCPKCGVQQAPLKSDRSDDDGSFLWAVLGFIIPVAGLVLWIIWLHEKPRSAKMAGLGALAAAIIWAFLAIPAIWLLATAPWHRGRRRSDGVLQEVRRGHRRRGGVLPQVRGPAEHREDRQGG
ncbi:MAG: zinc ribbon domain-containing protein [Candidatus Methanomethylophilaceae archaeon]|nr:zinc ribbon domain-containing protein [Candidatus Methanomethylophilaceae archaeon]MBR6203570.1 zinc ribbon domain-containing protein [Candidatus Methanomethylophilaceae archaeon]